jgi:hypothetical protein
MPQPEAGNWPGNAWCKRPSCPLPQGGAVGAIRGPSERGSLKVANDCSLEKQLPGEVAGQGYSGSPSVFLVTRGRCRWGRKGQVHPPGTAGYGSKRLRKECRDNIGKDHLSAETGDNLQRPRARGKTIGQRRWMVWRMSPYERGRRSNVLRGVVRHPGRVPGKGALDTRRRYEASRLQTRCWNQDAKSRTARVFSNQLGERGMRAGA